METTQDISAELKAQLILLAASNHEFETLRTLLRNGSANVQDSQTGYTPLHSAIAACKQSSIQPTESTGTPALANGQTNGQCSIASSERTQSDKLESASKTMRLLLQNGAIWNDLDKNNRTPGCLALELGLIELYDIMVDAGVRAEMLLNRLDDYEVLQDESEDEDKENQSQDTDKGIAQDVSLGETVKLAPTDADAAQAQPHLNADNEDITSEAYLRSDLIFSSDRLLDEDRNGVMMAWESEIMERTAELLVPKDGLRVLNIGHGMGIIDTSFQARSPVSHHIIEAHPEILRQMKTNGWLEKSNVRVHEGRWQDVVPRLIEEATLFDVIYFDTFAEDYRELRDFFSECVIGLLDDGGRCGYFNGLGADRQICYDIYIKVTEMDLFEAGYDVEWVTMKVPDLEKSKAWKGVKRRYFALNEYKLPVCTFMG